ncbi:MAG: DUF4838 domain-containing protein [Lachnospiraceae bacterium]|nr:DUF4838 domain-containing protein [uncultured Acetatifactor sp.]MCI8543803.1 DUF4838 domain-containing protein [Lachnospiraceae bacterium]
MENEFPIKKVLICGKDISEYAVVCPKGASPFLTEAAETFVRIIREAIGQELRVMDEDGAAAYEIVIGTTNRDTELVRQSRASLKNDGYAILGEGSRLFITGGNDRGAGYGVYSLLEDYMGVRFYASDCTVIHEAQTVEVPEGIRVLYSPVLEYRDLNWYDYIKNHDFASRNKVNCTGGKRTDVPDTSLYAEGFVHTLSALTEEPHVPDVQPCLTDEAVYRKVLGNVRKWLAKNPGAAIISVSQNDSYPEGLGCQCEKCRAIDEAEGSPMGSLLTFVNRIAGEIRAEYPDVQVDTLAYRYTRKTPKTIVPADNVIIRLCSVECSFAHRMDDADCEENAAFRQTIEDWAKVSDKLYIWDYTTDFAHYLAPYPNLHILWDNVRFFKEHNVVGVHEQGNYQAVSGEFGELRGYLLAKLLWNPDMTKERYFELMDEFLQDYYGEGWRYIREYIDRTAQKAAKSHMHLDDRPERYLPLESDEDRDFAREMTGLWEKALEAAGTEEYRNHVRKSKIQDEYYNLYMDFDGQVERNRALYQSLKEFGIAYHCESWNLPELEDFSVEPKIWSKYCREQAEAKDQN